MKKCTWHTNGFLEYQQCGKVQGTLVQKQECQKYADVARLIIIGTIISLGREVVSFKPAVDPP